MHADAGTVAHPHVHVYRCNNRKSDCHPRDLRSIGMQLAQYPRVPTFHELQNAARKYPPRYIHKTWEEFLYFESEISPGELDSSTSPSQGAGEPDWEVMVEEGADKDQH